MCGIAGFVSGRAGDSHEALTARARKMGATLTHRGPDADGVWADESAGIGFAHRRLAIVDLSANGAQPMHSACGRYVLIYNGELYNHRALRAKLHEAGADVNFRGDSDSETLLEACAFWGVCAAVSQFVGMFAFALWDRHKRRLTLVRDRLGIKPLYWARTSQGVLFGSELKALRAHDDCPREIDRSALIHYVRYNYIPAPLTIYKNVHKLPPGHMLVFDEGGDTAVESYWSAADKMRTGSQNVFQASAHEAADRLHDLLYEAVGCRLMSDVPLGAFLSGGIDSSTVVALMQAQSARPVKSFSIGFENEAYDESAHAAAVAKHLGCDHSEMIVTDKHAQQVIPDLPRMYDEPFADMSQIPTYLLSKMTRGEVTVALSGDGGDELFAGYERYFHTLKYVKLLRQPRLMRQFERALIKSLSPHDWHRLLKVLPLGRRVKNIGERLHWLGEMLLLNRREFYKTLTSIERDPGIYVLDGGKALPTFADGENMAGQDFLQAMQGWDMVSYLPDDILTKIDRASMAVSLEARVPLLDHRVAEFALSLPFAMRYRHGRGKWLLREVLHRYVPRELVERPKMGFGVPIGDWLRGDLRDWAEELLSVRKLRDAGLLDAESVRMRWQQHLSGRHDWQYFLWGVLMLMAWHDTQ